MEPDFLFASCHPCCLGSWIYLNGHCWPPLSVSDNILVFPKDWNSVSKDLSGDAAIAAVEAAVKVCV